MHNDVDKAAFRRFPFLSGETTLLHHFAKIHLYVLLGYVIWGPVSVAIKGWAGLVWMLVTLPMVFGVIWLFAGLDYLLRIRLKDGVAGQVRSIWDEREEAVFYEALAWGFGSSWITLILAVGWFIRRYQMSGGRAITMVSLSVILGVCFAVLVLVFSLSVIAQQRGEGEADA